MLDKGIIHVSDGTEQKSMRFHHNTHSSHAHFRTYELFISGMFHLIFLDYGLLWVTKTMESEPADMGGLP